MKNIKNLGLLLLMGLFLPNDAYSMLSKKLKKRKQESGRKHTGFEKLKKTANRLIQSCEIPEEKNEFSESSSDEVETGGQNKTSNFKISRSKTFYGQVGRQDFVNNGSEDDDSEIDFEKEKFTQIFAGNDEYHETDIELNDKVLQIAKKEYSSVGSIDSLFVTFCQLFVLNCESFKKDNRAVEELVDYIIEDMVSKIYSGQNINIGELNEIWFYYFYKLEGIAIDLDKDIKMSLFPRTSLNTSIVSERIKKSGLNLDVLRNKAEGFNFNLN